MNKFRFKIFWPVLLYFSTGTASVTTASSVCTSKNCEDESKLILEKIDDSIDPCDDFYHFACGNYIKSHQLSKDVHKFDEIEMLRSRVEREINETFYNIFEDENEMLSLSRRFYRSCMDWGA